MCAIFLIISGMFKYMLFRMETIQEQLDTCNTHAQLMDSRRLVMDSITVTRAFDIATQSSYKKYIQPTIDSIKIVNNVQ